MASTHTVIEAIKKPKHPREKSLHRVGDTYPIFELYRETQKGVSVQKLTTREQFLDAIKNLDKLVTLRRMWFIVRYGKGKINESVKYTNKSLCLISARIFSDRREVKAIMDEIKNTAKRGKRKL